MSNVRDARRTANTAASWFPVVTAPALRKAGSLHLCRVLVRGRLQAYLAPLRPQRAAAGGRRLQPERLRVCELRDDEVCLSTAICFLLSDFILKALDEIVKCL